LKILKAIQKRRMVISQMLYALIFGLLFILSMFISPLLIPESPTILKALIEIDAGMLGFWGIILVYALTSLDNDRDSLERQKFEILKQAAQAQGIKFSMAIKGSGEDEYIAILDKKIEKSTHSLRKMRRDGMGNGVMFIISIVASVIGLGIPQNILALYFIIATALYYFVAGAGFIFVSLWELRAEESP